jgi:hypothetical protein
VAAVDPEAAANGRPPEAAPPGVTARPIKLADSVPIRDRLAWDLADIASLLGVSRRLLERTRAAGNMPPPDIAIGRRILWRPATIDRWLDWLESKGGV